MVIPKHKRVFKRKVVLLGDSAVGKTSMMHRFVQDKFDDRYISTVGAKVSKKSVFIYDNDTPIEVTMMIWDIIGSQGYVSTQAGHIAGVDHAILVYDLSRRETFQSLMNYWIPLLYKVCSDIPPALMVAGNKADLVQDTDPIKKEDILYEFVKSGKCGHFLINNPPPSLGYFSTSAKTGRGVEECFETMAWMMYSSKGMRKDRLGEVMREVGVFVAEDIKEQCKRDTLLSVSDLIMAELSKIGPPDVASEILDKCYRAQKDFDKDDPTLEGLRSLINCVSQLALESGLDKIKVFHHKRKWLQLLQKIV